MAAERRLPPSVRAGLLAPYDSWANRIATLRFVQDIPLSADHPSHATLDRIEQDLHKLIDRPMQIIWGMRDWCFTPHFLEGWRQRFPAAAVHQLPDAGHYVLEDAIDQVLPLMTSFLSPEESNLKI